MNFPVFCDFLKSLLMNPEHRPQPWAWLEVPHSPAPCFQIRKARCRASWCLEWQRQGLEQMKAHLEYMDTWTSMDLQGHPQTSMDWTPMDPWTHGLSWTSMEVDGVPQKSMEFHWAQWRLVAGVHFSCVTLGFSPSEIGESGYRAEDMLYLIPMKTKTKSQTWSLWVLCCAMNNIYLQILSPI